MSNNLEKNKEKGKSNIFLNPSKKSKTKHKSSKNNSNNKNKEHTVNTTISSNPFTNPININSQKNKKNSYADNEKINKKENVININSNELFPELISHSLSSGSQKINKNKQKNIDFLGAIQCSEPTRKDIYDDIEPGWVVMYFDEHKQIRKEYGPSTGITEKIEKERIDKYKKEIDEIFEQRERDIQERIELFGDERLYKPELEDYKEPEIYYGNESDCEENSFTDDNGNGDYGYGDYQDDYI